MSARTQVELREVADHQLRCELITAMQDAGDPERARGQQAYMKSVLPFFGVRVPAVRKLSRDAARSRPFRSSEAWAATVRLIWRRAERREERYAAVEILVDRRHRPWLTPERLGLVEELVVEGAWWDLVDPVAIGGLGAMLSAHRAETAAALRSWAADKDIWKRRAAILSQIRHKDETDAMLLFDVIEPSIERPEFFLRKGIGWALREYSKTRPDLVVDYVARNADRLSPLSKREALKGVR